MNMNMNNNNNWNIFDKLLKQQNRKKMNKIKILNKN